MRVLALLDDPVGPSARLRFHAFRPALERAGCRVEVCAVPGSGPARWRWWKRAAAFDVVLVQRRLLPAFEVGMLRRRARRLVYDVDDAQYLRDRAPHRSVSRRWKFRAWARAADLVLAGNRVLADAVQRAGGRALCIPTTTPVAQAPATAGRSLVWVGQASTTRYLVPILDAVGAVARERSVRLTAIGAEPSQLAAHRDWVRALDWSPEAEEQGLAEGGIGLAPLPEDPWTQGKCGLRLLRYLSHGLRAVASPVGAQAEMAAGCPAVLTAVTDRDWVSGIRAHLDAPPEQQVRRGQLALSRAQSYATEAWTERFVAAVLEGKGSVAGRGSEG